MNVEQLFKNINNKNNASPTNTVGGDFVYNAALRGQQDVIQGYNDLSNYTKRGITPVAGENLDEYLHQTQSGWTKFGNAIVQTIGSELALGTVKAFSDIADLIGNAVFRSNGDYTNPVSKALEQGQEAIREWAPVYVDPKLNISNGGLLDAGWIASNIPSIASSLTLLLPSAGIVKGIQALGKAANIAGMTRGAVARISKAKAAIDNGKRLNKFQRFVNSRNTAKATDLFLENTTTAAISRTIENYQEGRQTYNDMYVQANQHFEDDDKFNEFVKRNSDKLDEAKIDKTNKDEVAKYVAKASADETFKFDYLNTIFDVMQLYALKNVWKSAKNAPETNRKILQHNKQAAKELGKTPEQIAELNKGIGKLKKTKDWIINHSIGQAKVIGAELSEGVEEAVNYIAQQEGMTFGNTLLTGEGQYSGFWERLGNGLDNRLNSYMNAPELWDSAFWGFMGGVVFQNSASGAKRLYNTILTRAADKSSEEVKSAKKPWYWIEQLPEVKRRIEDINYRTKKFDDYVDKCKKIDDGVDVFQELQFQEKGQLNTTELKEAAKKRAFEEYISDMTLSAMNNGNYDLLKAYLQDDNVRKALVEAGIFNSEGKTGAEVEAESKRFIDDAVKKMDEVSEEYDRELVSLDDITLSKKFKGRIPADIISIIAMDNIKARQAIRQQDEIIAGTNTEIANTIADLNKDDSVKLDPNVNYEQSLRLNTIGLYLGTLRQQRKKISKESDSISKRIALANIDRQIDHLESNLKDEELYYVTARSLQIHTNEQGELAAGVTDEFLDYYDKVITGNPEGKVNGKIKFETIDTELLKLSAKSLITPEGTTLHAHKLIEQDANATIKKLNEVSPSLREAYERKINAEITKEGLLSNINRDVQSVARRVGEINNTLNAARHTAIRNKGLIMKDLYKKHGNIIRDIVKAEFNGDTKTLNNLYSELDSKTVSTIKDVFKVFDFTKSYNEDIALSIENAFDEMDRVELAEKKKAEKNMEVENTGNSQSDSATQNIQMTNSSDEASNVSTGQQNGSQRQTTQQTDQNNQQQPQTPQTDSALPHTPNQATDATPEDNNNSNPQKTNQPQQVSSQSISAKVNIRSNNSNHTQNLNLNKKNDGSYEVLDEKLTDLNNDNLYDTIGVDLTRPHTVESRPIVRLNNGSYELVQQGKVVNTDTAEYQERQAQQTQSQQRSTSTGKRNNVTSNNVSPNTVGNQIADAIQQQDDESSAVDTSFNKDLEEELHNAQIASIYLTQQIKSIMIPKFLSNRSIDLEALFDIAVEHWVSKGYDRAALEAERTNIFSFFNRIKSNNKTKFQSSTDELIIEDCLGIFNNNDKSKGFRESYINKLESFIEAYCDEFGIPTINGKKYINIEDLLRYLDTVVEDNFTSRILYHGINEYLKLKEAKEKYIRTDELGNDVNDVDKTLNKSEEDRFIETINESLPQRINLNLGAINTSFEEEQELSKEMDSALASSKVGDELVYQLIGNKLIFKTKDGKIIGSNTLPVINKNSGVRTMKISNLIYDLDKDSTGDVRSKLKDLLYKWFTDDSDVCKELRSILYALTYENKTYIEKQKLCKKFANNPEVKQAIQDGLLIDISNDTVELLKTIEHLGNLFRFRNTKNTFNASYLKLSLDAWFDKVYDNYTSAIYLAQHPGTKIQISNITDGVIIRNAPNPTAETCTPVTQAIAGGVNTKINKIAITNRERQTIVAGSYPINLNFAYVTTCVTIPNRNGSTEYVRAFPAKIKDSFIGDDAKDMVKAIRSHFKQLLDNYAKDQSVDNFNALKRFIMDAFNYTENTCIFYGVKAFVNKNNRTGDIIVLKDTNGKFTIAINSSENTIDVFRPEYPKVSIDNGVYNKKKVPINDKTVIDTFNEIIDGIRFNINSELVSSDNYSEDAKIKGIVSKRSNKFTIKIGDQIWTYNSFNEFILNNNLVSINTSPNETGTSNFRRDKMSTLEYNIVQEEKNTSETSSPVEGSPMQPIDIPDNISKIDRVLNILNGTVASTHKGQDIFKIFKESKGNLSKDDIIVLNSIKKLGLLPKNIIFDESFNTTPILDKNGKPRLDENGNPIFRPYNAQSNIRTKQVTVGTKWLELFKNPKTRSFAIRVLVHEQLHLKLHSRGNEGYVQSIKDIFKEFENSITRESIWKYLKYLDKKGQLPEGIELNEDGVTKMLNHINTFRYTQYGDDIDTRLEEFLVDSLMNGDLIEYLNTVEVEDSATKTKDNLFTKIFNLLKKIFKWDVVKGSLREKELNSLQNVLINPENTTEQTIKKETNKKRKTTQPSIPGLFDDEIQQSDSANNIGENDQESNVSNETDSSALENTEMSSEESDETEDLNEEDLNNEEIEVEDLTEDELEIDEEEDMSGLDDIDTDRPFSSTNEWVTNNSYTPETQDIKDKAISNGTFMKAPNGNPTNLNERQWLQVRTKAFKNWFGDWENNPSKASKVVDENGEPKVMYHGTPWGEFNTFKHFQPNTGDRTKPGGIYFATNSFLANRYTRGEFNKGLSNPHIFEVFLNIRNPFINIANEIKERKDLIYEISKYYDILSEDEYDDISKLASDIDINDENHPYAHAYNYNIYTVIAEYFYNKGDINRFNKLVKDMTDKGFNDGMVFVTKKELDDGHISFEKQRQVYIINPNQIKSATDNTGEFSNENDDIRYSSTEELAVFQVKEDCQNFLNNFGINIDNYPISETVDRFDKINRLINANTEEEITDGVGQAVAFMMQYSRQFNELLTLKNINTPLQYKGVRRAIKNNVEVHIESKFNEEQRKKAIEEIGKDIAVELRRRYNIENKSSNTSSIMQKIKELINKFFELFTPNIKNQFRVINHNIRNIVDNIILNDPTIINPNNIKPGTFSRESIIVDYEKALKENPYEENIISILNSYDIVLAGSASMAVFGTVYRPSENPMHDIDFNAQGKTPAEIENILKNEFKNVYNTNTIIQGEGHTETYLILDRPFKIKHTKNDGTFILDANTEEYLGKYHYSNLQLAEGVKGKMLDFFLGNTSPYGTRNAILNGKEYKFTDPRNAILAKVTWSRRKDIFDYNRFISKEQKEKLNKKRKENTKEIINKIKKSNIIWASPTIGKTTYIKDHKDEIIEWDEEVNSKRNTFIKEQIDPNNTMTKEEYNNAKSEYMSNLDSHPEYVDFLTRKWVELKNKARKENKKIFASPLPLLKLFSDDFDLIINSNENVFFKRNTLRGGKEYSTRSWKQNINNVLTNINKNKIVTTDLYFSDLMDDVNKISNISNNSTQDISLTTASSFLDAQSQLPIELRSNFAEMVDSALITSQCK